MNKANMSYIFPVRGRNSDGHRTCSREAAFGCRAHLNPANARRNGLSEINRFAPNRKHNYSAVF